jgi:hypothetical protein
MGNDDNLLPMLVGQMKSGDTSIDEGQVRYLFNGEESYLFYAPLKYTDWMLVTVVPCKMIDIQAMMVGLNIMGLVALLLLVMVALTYFTIRRKRLIYKRSRGLLT